MNLRSKIALIFQKKDKTVRKIEEETGIPKSTAHHHKHQIIKRNQFEESLFWETQAGLGFLRRLVAAAIYTFCIKGGLGAGRAREFFGLIRIGTHVGISDSSILLIIKEIEDLLLKYRDMAAQGIKASVKEVELVLGVDETWFGGMYLVCKELSSGYIIMEEKSEDRSASTWGDSLKKN